MQPRRRAPGPRPNLILGNVRDLWHEGPLLYFSRMAREYGPAVSLRFGPRGNYLLLSDPDGAQHMLQKNNRNYAKGTGYDGLRLVLGNGLVTSNGEFWRRQRKLAQPAFGRGHIEGWAADMAECTAEMLDTWQSPRLNIHDEMMAVTLKIVARTLFGTSIEDDIATTRKVVPIVLEFAALWVRYPVHPPLWAPTRSNLKFRRAMALMDELVDKQISERRNNPSESGNTLVELFMNAAEDGDRMSDAHIRDEVKTMVGAGHETTASLLTFVWIMLDEHPAVKRKLFEEVDAVLGTKRPTIETVRQLTYMEQVLNETLRLYPPVWNIGRTAQAEDRICGYDVAHGDKVMVNIHTLHRNPKHWPAPETFAPERFTADAEDQRHKWAHLPFIGGPRICIGKHFAMMEAKIVLAMILQRFDLQGTSRAPLHLSHYITLRPTNRVEFVTRPSPLTNSRTLSA